MHAPQRTAAGVLHFITVDRGCAPDAEQEGPTCADGDDAVHVSYPVFNASRKVVLGPRAAFEPAGREGAAAHAADAGGAAVPARYRAGCADAARLPPQAPSLVVRLGSDDAGARVFVERRPLGAASATAAVTWEELRERMAPEMVPSFCAAVLGVAHGATNEAAYRAR